MKKNSLIILIFLLLASCQEKKLEIKLLTKEIVSKRTSIDSMDIFYNYCKFNNENEKYLFTNVVKFELFNNTDKKYLFFIKDINLNDIYNIDMIIEDEKGNIEKIRSPLIDPFINNKMEDYWNYFESKRINKEMSLKKIGYNVKKNISNVHQDIIIHQKEKLIFFTTLMMPFIVEDTELNLRSPIYFKLNPKKKYTFRLKYTLKTNVEEILSKEIIKNLKENNIEIFKGEIETQKIPIVFKK